MKRALSTNVDTAARGHNTVPAVFLRGEEGWMIVVRTFMKAQVFISQSEGVVEVSVVMQGLSSGAGHKYKAVEEARTVLLAFGFDSALVDRQFRTLSETPPSVLLRFPMAEIADDVLTSLGFMAAAFRAA